MAAEGTRRISFLLGAGISIKAGMPSTARITSRIFSGEDIYRSGVELYLPGPGLGYASMWSDCLKKIIPFLRLLDREVKLFRARLLRLTFNKRYGDWDEWDVETNNSFMRWFHSIDSSYEEVCNLADQISEGLNGWSDNAAIIHLANKLESEIQQLPSACNHPRSFDWDLPKLAEETSNYIRDVVWLMLQRRIKDVTYLNGLLSIALDNKFDSVDIFTLNHDQVIESWLVSNQESYADGFNAQQNNIRLWEPHLLYQSESRIRVLKLHGSIDWYQFQSQNQCPVRVYVGMRMDGGNPLELYKTPDDQDIHMLIPRPKLLIGTETKPREYNTLVFDDLHHFFRTSLRTTQCLVVAGYGFRDRGINYHLSEWIHTSTPKRVVLVHPDPERLRAEIPGAIGDSWDELREIGRWVSVNKRVEELQRGELEQFIS